VNYTASRALALGEALRRTLGRPVEFVLVAGSTAVLLGVGALAALALWRAGPLDVPSAARPQALILAGGAQGEIDLGALQAALRRVATVASSEFVGRDAALSQLAQRKNLSSLGLAELRPNPLPDAFVVGFTAGAAPEAIEAAVAELRKVKNVESVEYQPELYRRIWLLGQLGSRLGVLLAAALAAALVIGVALTATLWGRVDPEEIRLLDLLGAEPAIVRRPYVYAGAISLLLAAALGWLLVVAASSWLEPWVSAAALQFALPLAPALPLLWAGVAFCLGAALVGALVASAAARMAIRG